MAGSMQPQKISGELPEEEKQIWLSPHTQTVQTHVLFREELMCERLTWVDTTTLVGL
jgi:hypothetical protein